MKTQSKQWISIAMLLSVSPLYSGEWKVIHSFPAPSSQTNGMAWDGQALWHSNEFDPIIYKLDPISGSVLSTITTSVPDQGDIAFHQGQLWVNSENEHMIYHVNHNSGETITRILFDVSIIPDPGVRWGNSQFEGLTSDGTSLWLDFSDSRARESQIYRVDPATGERLLKYSSDFGGYADGLAWGWGNMFMATNNTEILEIDACSGQILDIFRAPAGVDFGPEGLTFDGEYLWFADNTTDRIYQIQLMDDFLTKPAAKSASSANACSEENSNVLRYPDLMIPEVDIGGNGPDAIVPTALYDNIPANETSAKPVLFPQGYILYQNNPLRLDGKRTRTNKIK